MIFEPAWSYVNFRDALLALTVGSAFVACADGSELANYTDRSDTMVVYSRFPPPETPRWRLEPTPALSIGVTEGDPHYEFARIVGVVSHRAGYLVADGIAGEIRQFDGKGVHIKSVGGTGEGPGEFRQLRWLGKRTDGSVLAWDLRNRRLTVFSDDLQYVDTWPLAIDDTYVLQGVFGDGDLLVRPFERLPPSASAGLYEGVAGFAAIDLANPTVLEPRLELPARPAYLTTDGTILRLPFTTQPSVAVGRSSIWAGNGIDGLLVRYNQLGRSEFEVRLPMSGRIEASDVDRYVGQDLEHYAGAERSHRASQLAQVPTPSEFPSYDAVLADSEGNVWIRSYLRPEDSRQLWVVLAPQGEALGVVETPRRLQLEFVTPDQIVGVWRDDLGVESVRIHRLVKQ